MVVIESLVGQGEGAAKVGEKRVEESTLKVPRDKGQVVQCHWVLEVAHMGKDEVPWGNSSGLTTVPGFEFEIEFEIPSLGE
ncbi:hypothetical protein AMTR_s00060p00137610 [Amborella trichopoda]|uniref:Uncharacterized protein n=1 Tax=Amborella trichopoda TaxID=13333 RepID=W1NK80_AMBTC|nr:hypothetical protein AMTR_s00060p00137610 [Amborella trichopoda]